MDLASSVVSVTALPLPKRIPEAVMLPGSTMMTLLPMLAICCWIRSVAPEPTETIAITAPTPIMMPSIVRAERSLLIRNARKAIFIAGITLFIEKTLASARGSLGHHLFRLWFFGRQVFELVLRVARLRNRLVADQVAVF